MLTLKHLGAWLVMFVLGMSIGWVSNGQPTRHIDYPQRIVILEPQPGTGVKRHELVVTRAIEAGDPVELAIYDPAVRSGPAWKIEFSGSGSQRFVLFAEKHRPRHTSDE